MGPKKQLVSWFEIPVNDMERARKFYEAFLGVSLREMALDDGLRMVFFPVEESGIGGALCKHDQFYKTGDVGVVIYFTADPDIETMLSVVSKNGGEIIMNRKIISPESGSMGLFRDTEGNRIAIYAKP